MDQPQMPPQMPMQQAMGIISDVCRRAQGDLDFHNAVQTALATIGGTLSGQEQQIQQLTLQLADHEGNKKALEGSDALKEGQAPHPVKPSSKKAPKP